MMEGNFPELQNETTTYVAHQVCTVAQRGNVIRFPMIRCMHLSSRGRVKSVGRFRVEITQSGNREEIRRFKTSRGEIRLQR